MEHGERGPTVCWRAAAGDKSPCTLHSIYEVMADISILFGNPGSEIKKAGNRERKSTSLDLAVQWHQK